jgi:hypothetical protein
MTRLISNIKVFWDMTSCRYVDRHQITQGLIPASERHKTWLAVHSALQDSPKETHVDPFTCLTNISLSRMMK